MSPKLCLPPQFLKKTKNIFLVYFINIFLEPVLRTVKLYMKDGSQDDLVINSKITCTDSNITYCISCTKQSGACAKVHSQYIGETGKPAKERCARHIGTTPTTAKPTQPSPWG